MGGYGSGLSYAGMTGDEIIEANNANLALYPVNGETPQAFPREAAAPTETKLHALERELTVAGMSNMKRGDAAYISSDWSTRGNWIGRYGYGRTLLCASCGVGDHDVCNDSAFEVDGDIGPNRDPADGMRRWIQWTRTDDPRVL